RIEEPFETAASEGSFDVQLRLRGGGLTGQADAIRLGVARALAVQDDDKRVALRESGMLTRDARKVERKKPGRPKARKRFQFSKR
ncbi:MAG: 30S ribosomal protein S9, partial [Gemmatimonadetes bacterium]|nr:30S ribosomal protein S9 [Gemmatimonadota bacterium]